MASPPSFNLADLFESVAAAVPDRTAVVDGQQRRTYRELDGRAGRLAGALRGLGLAAGEHVAIWMPGGAEYLEVMLAAFKLGAVPINVNFRYTGPELTYLLEDADCVGIVLDPAYSEQWESIRPTVPAVRFTLATGEPYESAIAAASPGRAPERSGDDHYIVYTGGTTGMPKGVVWRHEDIFFAAMGGSTPAGERFEEPAEVATAAAAAPPHGCLPTPPLIHGSAQWAAFSMFNGGGTVVLPPAGTFDPEHTWDLVEREGVGMLVIVGDAFAVPLVDALRREPERWDLGGLRRILSGGAQWSPRTKGELRELLPGAKQIDVYGASESGSQSYMATPASGAVAALQLRTDDRTQVIDEQGRPIAPGSTEIGRLARRGRVPLGYYNDPQKSAATFPTLDGTRWSVPGDLATVAADGSIHVLGRGSTCINTGGEKVYPDEVEVVLKDHADVRDALVVGVPHERFGQAVACVVHAGPDLQIGDLVAHCRSQLAGYKVPRVIAIAPKIERIATGKPDYEWAGRTVERDGVAVK